MIANKVCVCEWALCMQFYIIYHIIQIQIISIYKKCFSGASSVYCKWSIQTQLKRNLALIYVLISFNLQSVRLSTMLANHKWYNISTHTSLIKKIVGSLRVPGFSPNKTIWIFFKKINLTPIFSNHNNKIYHISTNQVLNL